MTTETHYEADCLGCDFAPRDRSESYAHYLASEHKKQTNHDVDVKPVEVEI